MKTWQSLSFLLIFVGMFSLGLGWFVLRDRLRSRPKSTVEHFYRSRLAMRNAYHHHQEAKQARRDRSRADHPAARKHGRHQHRRSA